MTLAWRKQLNLGHNALDNDHMYLLSLINQAESALRSPSKRGQLQAILKELQAYTHSHFSREEQLMAAVGYPGLEKHKQSHTDLANQLQGIADKFLAGDDEILTEMATEDMVHLMRSWLIDHIIKEDLLLKPYL